MAAVATMKDINTGKSAFPKHIIVFGGDMTCEWPNWEITPKTWRCSSGDMRGDTLGVMLQELGMKFPARFPTCIDKETHGTYVPDKVAAKMFDQIYMSCDFKREDCAALRQADGEDSTGMEPDKSGGPVFACDEAIWAPQSIAEVQTFLEKVA